MLNILQPSQIAIHPPQSCDSLSMQFDALFERDNVLGHCINY